MFAYWLLFGLFAVGAVTEQSRRPGDFRADPVLIVLGIFMILMIGLRFHVGADYEAYLRIFDYVSRLTFLEALQRDDPGYHVLNWVVASFDGSVWLVNLVCGGIFGWGLLRLCQTEPSPRTAALVAIPYLVIVVAMGYTRQAVAIGFIMAGIASLARGGSSIKFIVYVAFAALFHKTSVVVLPLAIFAGQRNHFLNALAVLVAAYALYDALLEESVDQLVASYIDARYESQGAAIRVAMNVVPALIILFAGRQLCLDERMLRFWRLVAFAALACVPALFLLPSTTAVDRVALYLLPIQVVGIGRSIFLFKSYGFSKALVVGYCFAVLYVWLNFASHSFAWLPYRTVIQ
ncbi:EpsG family protein [Sphingomonas sp. HDW15A]|uniref:EpsG family protein n=1 Tax=Sphingomonas sp. HDW15A TaxID=2714942 RepID=UPI00140C95D9|nr:EpsG family protein [Sphingomonas sp. HDW15A]QIK95827.1 EpsG family protein [Sphingomonas sp. HDW15A]